MSLTAAAVTGAYWLFRGLSASATKLLRDVLERHRTEVQQRYRAPFEQRIEQFGNIVYGNSFSVDVGDDLGIERRTLDGRVDLQAGVIAIVKNLAVQRETTAQKTTSDAHTAVTTVEADERGLVAPV